MAAAALQVLAAVVIVIMLMAIALWQFNRDKLTAIKNTGTIKRNVVIFDGIKDFATNKNELYDLYNTNGVNYMNLSNSVNQDSGMEYSYNFWLYIDQTALSGTPTSILGKTNSTMSVTADAGLDSTNLSPTSGNRSLLPMVLFQRGDPHVYTYKSVCSGNYKTDAIVKNPIVKLENGGDVLSVEFNTLDYPDAHLQCPSASVQNLWSTANQQKIGIQGLTTIDALNAKWFMVTVVVQQTNPLTALSNRNNSICTIYVNGVNKLGPVQVAGISPNSSVRTATGDLYVNKPLYSSADASTTYYSLGMSDSGASINPPATGGTATSDGKLMMANLTYFNYALGPGDVTGLFGAGFTNQVVPTVTATSLTAGLPSGVPMSTPFTGSMPSIGS